MAFMKLEGVLLQAIQGQPTVGVLQSIKDNYQEIYSEFSVNEKLPLKWGLVLLLQGQEQW